MKLYEIGIKPASRFGTPLKGDTLFGHFIWQLILDSSLLKIPLKEVIESYKQLPFIIFSSVFPKIYWKRKDYFFPKRPELPLSFFTSKKEEDSLYATIKNRKKQKKKKYIQIETDLKVICESELLKNEKEIFELYLESGFLENLSTISFKLEIESTSIHNRINRLTQTTGDGFAPYNQQDVFFLPGIELSLFVLLDEEVIEIDSVLVALERIGLMGYGRDASSGLGRFILGEEQELVLPDYSATRAIYTLSPCLPKEDYIRAYFQPFTRFGKHGLTLANSKNPFKQPVLMVDEGAVFEFNEPLERPFIGQGISGLSKVEPNTISQGYSLVLPIYFKNGD